jgi:chitin disaccharide deacetylase
MGAERFLIVNADDLGLCAGVDAGIVEAHERGIVTSASLMVRRPSATSAAGLAGSHPGLSVGLHIDLGGWDREAGEWRAPFEEGSPTDEAAAERECRAQLAAFEELAGRPPTHLDSHHHTHLREPVASVAARLVAELGVPLRGTGRVRYEGGFYGQGAGGEAHPEGIAAERLVELIESLPAGWTEIGCHPGRGAAELSSYGVEREREIETLCDPRVREAIERVGVELRSFAQLD